MTHTTKTANPVIINANLAKYFKFDVKSPCGRSAIDIGDPVADKLRGKTIEQCYTIAAKRIVGRSRSMSIPNVEADLKAKYQRLNIGMQRMNLGNKMRHLNKH